MAALEIPKSSDSLSAEWLTAALQGSGAGNARVSSFEYEPIAAGVGFLGKLGRLRLQYAGAGDGMPRTLVCKLPTLDEKSRQLAMMFRFYEREVSFYRDIARGHSRSGPASWRGRSLQRRLRHAARGSRAGAGRRSA
jgi:hypothetical protein